MTETLDLLHRLLFSQNCGNLILSGTFIPLSKTEPKLFAGERKWLALDTGHRARSHKALP